MSLVLNTRAPYRFSPLVEQITKAREVLTDVIREVAEANKKLALKPDDIDVEVDLCDLKDKEEEAQEALDALERELAENPKQPVYLLRVPTYRSNDALIAMALELPQSPSDRRMFRAIQKAAADGAIPLDDQDLLAVEDGLKTSGGGVPDELNGAFQNLFDLANDHPEVRRTVVARHKANSADRILNLRFHLLGWENVSVDGVPARFMSADNLAAEHVIDAIPPADIRAILAKLGEMNSVRTRVGNSSASPSPSPTPQSASVDLAPVGEPGQGEQGEAEADANPSLTQPATEEMAPVI